MVLRYRVSLPGLKGFTRLYELKPSSTLYSFHKQMRVDMDFPQDQLILFKAFDAEDNVSSRYGIFDLGNGTIDEITMAQCREKGEDKFIYFYDTTNVKSVIITYEGEGKETPRAIYPILVESKGPNPIEFENGYTAFEDLPEDKKRKSLMGGDYSDEDYDDDDDYEEDEDDDYDDDDIEEVYDGEDE